MYQKLVIVGNLGRDPEMRYTPSGQAVTNLSVAANRRYTRSDGEQVEETTWFRVAVWGRQAETVNQYLSKGRQVLIEGRLNPDESGNPRTWKRDDGSVGASFEVNAQRVIFLGGRGEGGFGDEDAFADAPETEDEIPF